MEKKYLVGLFMVLLMASCTTSQAPAVNEPIQNAPEVEAKEPTSVEVNIATTGEQDPNQISIVVGGVVTWKNIDTRAWSIYSSDGNEVPNVKINAGETYDHKFDTPGTYKVLSTGKHTLTIVVG